jgi:hypothetical protein
MFNKNVCGVAIVAALALAGCGGGGDVSTAGTDTPPASGGGGGGSGLTYAITEANAVDTAAAALDPLVLAAGSFFLFASSDAQPSTPSISLQQIIMRDMLARYDARRAGGELPADGLRSQAVFTEQELCSYGGRRVITTYDKDGDEETGHVGDWVEVRFEACKDWSNVVFNGSIRMETKDIRVLTNTRVAGVLEFRSDLSISMGTEVARMRGAMTWDIDFTRTSPGADDILTAQFNVSANDFSLSVNQMSVVYNQYSYRADTQDAMRYWRFDVTERVTLNGKSFAVDTEQPFEVRRKEECPVPHAGVAMIRGAASQMRVTANPDKTTLLEIDENGDGKYDKTKRVPTREIYAGTSC